MILLGAVAARAEQIPVRVYTTSDGLAHDEINRIVRDSRGFLWFCTSDGLSRFDSHSFTTYTTRDGLPHRSIRDILETRSGAYWIATARGICRLHVDGPRSPSQPICAVHKPAETGDAQNVFRLVEDRAGVIWVGTFGGLYRLDTSAGAVSFRYAAEFGMPATRDDRLVQDILEDRHGSLWVATRGSGLYRRLPDGRVQHFSTGHGLPPRINALLERRDGSLLVGTNVTGVARLTMDAEGSEVHVMPAYAMSNGGLPSNWVRRLFESAAGALWIATSRGVTRVASAGEGETPSIATFTTANGLADVEASALAEDPDGNLWIGTPSRGAMKLARNGFVTFGKPDGLGIPAAGSIFEGSNGELYLFANGIVSRFDGRRFENVRPNFPRTVNAFSWGRDQIALQDHAGDWWFATAQGLSRFARVNHVEELSRAQPKALYTVKDGLPGVIIFRLFEDARGDIWINSLSAERLHLTRWIRASGTFVEQTPAQGWLTDTWVNAFAQDASGAVWIATSNKGLARYTGGRFHFFTTADGLPANVINDLHFDRMGRLWMTLDESGVAVADDPAADRPRFRNYSVAAGLSSEETIGIAEDTYGGIYITSGKGIDRLDAADGRIRHYTAADGLVRGAPVLAFRDRTGALWFGSNYELSRFVPDAERPSPPPATLVSSVRIAGIDQPVPLLGASAIQNLRLQPAQNQVTIDFFGMVFRTGDPLQYQYRLEGADRDWSAPTEQRTVTYASLSPGHYRFVVRSAAAAGGTSLSAASVAFTILPPIWLRWWFLTAATLAAALAIYAAHRYRVAHLVQLHRMRMRIATDLHDDIGASLSRVAIMSEVAKRQIAAEPEVSASMLGDIAHSARDALGSLRDVVWAIDPRHDTLEEVLARVRQFAAGLLEAQGIQWEFDAPSDLDGVTLDPEQRRELFLFYKEAIHNLLQHSSCRSARATIALHDGLIIAQVGDDGRGLAADDVAVSSKGNGVGLSSLRTRADRLAGELRVTSLPDGGTELTLTFPLDK
jgi:ligand-binding sensor domain-containing protein/signal transduction histidine kinase